MTTLFRRSGTLLAYRVTGRIPKPVDLEAKLSPHRFRSIDAAANEDSSSGWVSPGDPTGNTFDADDMEFGRLVWLRIRIDVKKLPAARVQIERTAAERSLGRPMSVRERREWKAELEERLLPSTLPRTQFVDVLWAPKRGAAFAFAPSKAAREEVERLLTRTFGVSLLPMDPECLGEFHHRVLEHEGARVGEEFLTWLLFQLETEGGDFEIAGHDIGVAFDDVVRLGPSREDTDSIQTVRCGTPTRTAEVAEGLRQGRRIQAAKLVVARGEDVWTFLLDAATLSLRSVKLPDDDPEDEAFDKSVRRAEWFVELHAIVVELFRRFFALRAAEGYGTHGEGAALQRWIEGRRA